ncbi:MAG TPA: AAA family ATPase [Phototrophicaceae bacterium]|nr:AAA family ATPase [Phototrophicaceae bacterium]
MAVDGGAGGARPLLGRAQELDRIDEMVGRLASGRGGVVVLIGPPGRGLTTLLEEAITRAGQAVEHVRAVHVPSGLLEGDASAAVAASAVLGEAFRDLAGVVLEVIGDTGDDVALDDPRLVQVALTALRTLSGERPLLVTVDNLPVTDGAALTALASLAAGIYVMPVLVVLTSHVLPRSSFEESPVGPLWVHHVPPLGRDESVALVRAAADRWVPHPVAATIARIGGGNPGDLVEVCRSVEPDQLAGLEPLPDALPGTATTAATYRAWWDALGERERLLVLGAAASARPDRATLEECAAVALPDVAGPDGQPALREERGLVLATDPRLLSAVRALTPARELRSALRALAACHPEDSLDRHWLALRGGEPVTPEVLDALVRGARDHLDRGEAETVEALVGDVVERPGPPVPPLELLLLGGVAAMYCGHPARAVTLLTTALAETSDGLGKVLPLLLIAMTYREDGLPHRLVASCLQRLEGTEPRAAASIAALAARLCVEHGEDEAAVRYLDQADALLLADTAGPHEDDELDAELALAHAMVEHRRPVPGTGDALAALGTRRTGSDLAGWLREVQRLEQLIDHRDWVQARGEVADLRARIRRFPAPLLRAHVALAQVRLHLALCEYRRADEIAAAAVEERLPLHVPRGGAGLALLAQVALVRGRAAEADGWLADVGELAQERFGEPTAALDEALGLRARLADDVAAATDHYRRAVRAGSVLPSTVLDLVHMRWRTGVGDEELTAYLTARGAGGDPAFTTAAALVRAPAEEVAHALAATARGHRNSLLPAHEAQLLEFAADVSTAHDDRMDLLRRARDLYAASGAVGRAAAATRELTRLERSSPPAAVDLSGLTDDELTIARLVHGGATNKEVASALYVSVRTVELRLTSIYRKLGIGTRRELRQVADLAPEGGTARYRAEEGRALERNARSMVEDVDGV